jgi:multidrug efflux system outer membrane protein
MNKIVFQTVKRGSGMILLAALTAGCTVGPDYAKPSVETPAAYHESELNPGVWKSANPSDTAKRGEWWEIFGDPVLTDLEKQVELANQSLAASVHRIDQARALARVSASELYPNANLNGDGSVGRNSDNTGNPVPTNYSRVQVGATLTYEADLWGRIRRSVESSKATLQAQQSDYEAVRLSLHAQMATTYFQIRSTDGERLLLRRTLATRKEALDLVQKRFQGGVSNELDVTRAQTELATTEAEMIALDRTRGELEHAMAVLVGQPASTFRFPESPLIGLPPLVPVGLPSQLLERRPDVASAERLMASANAQIGVAKAAYFPVFSISANGAFESIHLGSLLDWPSRLWAVGPSISLPLFNGGRLKGNLEAKEAAYLETVANYKQAVLVAYKDVEDALVDWRVLGLQSEAVARSVASARKSAEISEIRYKDGLVNYLEVVDTERSALQTERAAVQLLGQRYTTAVFLIRALGGSWAEAPAAVSATTTPSATTRNPPVISGAAVSKP